jgi:hypothetical protein
MTYAVTDSAGLPETELPDNLVEQLPANVAPAPWLTRDCTVVTWLNAIEPAALDAVPAAVRPAGATLVAWALVQYGQTPVGPYSEVAATVLSGSPDGYGHIPFIVVDSLPSIVGGRANWLLPKALARFEWSDGGRAVTVTSDQPQSPAWSLSVTVEPMGTPAAAAIPSRVQQASTSGVVRRFDGEIRGALSAAKVVVDGKADGPLAALLMPGTYDGTMIESGAFDVGPLE